MCMQLAKEFADIDCSQEITQSRDTTIKLSDVATKLKEITEVINFVCCNNYGNYWYVFISLDI